MGGEQSMNESANGCQTHFFAQINSYFNPNKFFIWKNLVQKRFFGVNLVRQKFLWHTILVESTMDGQVSESCGTVNMA